MFQTERFGRVLLEGEDLGAYGIWRTGLDRQDAVEWEGFLMSLKHGEDLKKRLDAFHFTRDPVPRRKDAKADETGLAAVPRPLIIDSLKSRSGK
jgi:hypothetical protein